MPEGERATLPAAGNPQSPAEGAPLQECDLVMKGGITSGVVYPPAIRVLKGRYRFRSIGGTSAGAIAAAAAAAAEYGRAEVGRAEDGRTEDGFDKLERLSGWLGGEGHLLGLFQPSPETRPLMATLLALAEERKRAGKLGISQVGAALGRHNPGPVRRGRLLGLVAGLLLALALTAVFAVCLLVFGDLRSVRGLALAFLLLGLILATPFAWLGGIGWGLFDLYRILTRFLPGQNFFGVCNGMPDGVSDGPALTSWLSESLNDLAGLAPSGEPLTFRQLGAKRIGATDAGITLRMMTTNLSHGQPYVMPFQGDALFLFNRDEMARLFPSEVVDYLVEAAQRLPLPLPERWHALPEGDDLPVIVATRMSLSFPVLLSAVPLYTINQPVWERFRALEKSGQAEAFTLDINRDLERNWFSDGGITSNFPIHFFDAWLPSRPTFGINLLTLPEDPAGGPGVGSDTAHIRQATTGQQRVFLPKPKDPPVPEWQPIASLVQFGQAIVFTMKNYRDNMQSVLPSYRERVVQIRLSQEEGGLNLAMDPATIKRMTEIGEEAGNELLDFGLHGFGEHQWVRLRVLAAQLEREVQHLKKRGFGARDRYETLFRAQVERRAQGEEGRWYRAEDEAWCDEALARLDALIALAGVWEKGDPRWRGGPSGEPSPGAGRDDPGFFAHNAPAPPSVLRVTPEI